jgi:hypothetical protein
MQIDPINGQHFTDTGRFLKTLHCPRQKTWNGLNPSDTPGTRHCADCSSPVYDTATMTDQDLVDLLESNPHACLMVSFTQANCTVRPWMIDGNEMPCSGGL